MTCRKRRRSKTLPANSLKSSIYENMEYSSNRDISMFRILRLTSPLGIPSDDWLPAQNEICLCPDWTRRLIGKCFIHYTFTLRGGRWTNSDITPRTGISFNSGIPKERQEPQVVKSSAFNRTRNTSVVVDVFDAKLVRSWESKIYADKTVLNFASAHVDINLALAAKTSETTRATPNISPTCLPRPTRKMSTRIRRSLAATNANWRSSTFKSLYSAEHKSTFLGFTPSIAIKHSIKWLASSMKQSVSMSGFRSRPRASNYGDSSNHPVTQGGGLPNPPCRSQSCGHFHRYICISARLVALLNWLLNVPLHISLKKLCLHRMHR